MEAFQYVSNYFSPYIPAIQEENEDYTLYYATALTALVIAVTAKCFCYFRANPSSLAIRNVQIHPTKNTEDQEELLNACRIGDLGKVIRLIGEETNIFLPEKNDSLLHAAVTTGNIDIVNLLIEKGLDPNIKTPFNQTPLHFAAERGHIKVAEILLGKGAEIDIQTNSLKTPLFMAAESGNLELVKLLIKNSADINISDIKRHSPLHIAVLNKHKEVVTELLNQKVNLEAVNEKNQTPLHCAYIIDNKEIIDLLIQKGANQQALDQEKRKPSQYRKPIQMENFLKNSLTKLLTKKKKTSDKE